MKITVKIKRLSEETKLPAYAYPGDAAFDLLAGEETVLVPGERRDISTGLSFEIPEGYAGLIWDKSGIAMKGGIKTLGGVVDSGYRGEVRVGVVNLSAEPYVFEKGHKVAQMIIQKIEQAEIIEVEELSDTDRGVRGFGSSGK